MRYSRILFFSLILMLAASFPGRATTYQGADLTYMAVAPNIYLVSAKVYRDCSGPALQATENLTIKSLNCTNSRTVAMALVSGSAVVGTPYCSNAQNSSPCDATSTLPNFEAAIYHVTITITSAELQCPELLLSMTLSNRATTENLAGNTDLYTEAYLKVSSNIINNSPEFTPGVSPVLFPCVNQDFVNSVNTSEADGDSLSYELVSALSAPNTPVTYNMNSNAINTGLPANTMGPIYNNTTGKCELINLNVAPSCTNFYKTSLSDPRPLPYQTAILPANYCNGGASQGYSPVFPLPVGGGTIDWVKNCQSFMQVTPPDFTINPVTGAFQFRPNVFHPNTQPVAGKNKYTVVVKINEWRKINGVVTKIGAIRREMLVVVSDCSSNNALPFLLLSTQSPIIGNADTVKNVQTCSTNKFVLKFRDNDLTDLLDAHFPGAVSNGNNDFYFPNIPGLIMKSFVNKLHQLDVVFYMTPLPSEEGKDYFFNVRVRDNACPINGEMNQVFRIHINRANRLGPVANNRDRTIALGQSAAINMYFTRPDSINQQPAIYTYHWTETNAVGGLPNGLNPADQNKKDIVVTPTQTTRYFLSATSNLPGCIDTASVIVRVNGTTGISKAIAGKINFSAFPNPFSEAMNFKIQALKPGKGELIITDILGKEIDRIILNGMPAGEKIINWPNAKNKPAGQYAARLILEDGSAQTIKFTKLQ